MTTRELSFTEIYRKYLILRPPARLFNATEYRALISSDEATIALIYRNDVCKDLTVMILGRMDDQTYRTIDVYATALGEADVVAAMSKQLARTAKQGWDNGSGKYQIVQ